MELKKCPEGHYYDASVSSECPICQQLQMGGGNTAPSDGQPQEAEGPTWSGGYAAGRAAAEMAAEGTAARPAEEAADDEKTVAFVPEANGVNPVVGWLIGLTGAQRGMDYRIHADNNYIGRSEQMDICIRGDDSISRMNHAVLAYDTRGKAFYFGNGEGRSLVRLNNEVVLSTVKLKAYDVIEIGRTRLIFIPLCGEGFDWDHVE